MDRRKLVDDEAPRRSEQPQRVRIGIIRVAARQHHRIGAVVESKSNDCQNGLCYELQRQCDSESD